MIDAHPECADVIREAMRLLDPPDDFKVLLAERTSDEEIQKTIAALSKCRNARMLEKVIRHRHF